MILTDFAYISCERSIDRAGAKGENSSILRLQAASVFSSLPLPEILINSDDYGRVWTLAERSAETQPYVSAYLERELKRAQVCDPWDPAGVSMGQRVLFRLDDEAQMRMGRLCYPHRLIGERGHVTIMGPVGAALIGMHRNATIEWLDKERTRTLTVLDYGW